MRRLLTIMFILNFGLAFGQDFSYPSINKQGKDINNFIPNNWTLLDSTQGDLNKDNHKDLALIVQHKDSVTIINNDNDSVLTQPRILIILFYNQAINQYQLAEQSISFILNHDNPNMEEPYQDISINNGVLKIDFNIFMNMGGWGMSNNSYKFRFQDTGFVLIGADYNYVNRGSGETEYRSYNFLTKKVKVSTGTIESDKHKIIWRTIDLKKLKTLKTFKQPFTWEVEKDYYL
ncbi:hypothetical protein WG954_13780 [Lacibacter sp. H375]|uniref:hypothetical protein n=1 Tax=Lacibacter sp. H375 TaxID=3133424 RepID=UPI0030C2EA5E